MQNSNLVNVLNIFKECEDCGSIHILSHGTNSRKVDHKSQNSNYIYYIGQAIRVERRRLMVNPSTYLLTLLIYPLF
jgi:hypothetical protein